MLKLIVLKKIIYISLAVHLISAFFSSGFHHFDEHFQIFEFMSLKLGNTTASQLPWEYRDQIRPWFQPFTYLIFYKILNAIGINSSLTIATILRIMTSLLGWLSLLAIGKGIRGWFRNIESYTTAIALLHLSWFIPYIHARTSSENFSLIFFALAFAFLFAEKQFRKNGLIAGFLLGLSFLSRFQMVFVIAPLWFWFLFFKRQKLFLFSLALGIILAIFLGGIIDYWGYGNLTFPLWEYFKANILGGAMQATGNSYPAYWYLRWAFLRGIPPISIFFFLGLLFVWIKKYRHPLTWMTLPFFIFHSLISHKEMRFIFFLCLMSPIALALLIESYNDHFKKYKKLYRSVVAMNIALLLYVSLRPANPAINFYSYMKNHPEITSMNVYDENPYTMLGLNLNFYKKDVPHLVMNTKKNPDFSRLPNGYNFFTKGEWMSKVKSLPECKLIYSAYPSWVLNYNYFNWIKKSRFWSLFHCSK